MLIRKISFINVMCISLKLSFDMSQLIFEVRAGQDGHSQMDVLYNQHLSYIRSLGMERKSEKSAVE